MRIINETNGNLVSQGAQVRDSFFGRFKGLILAQRKDIVLKSKKEGIKESSIHMCGMLYPLDVIWLDSHMEVIDVREDVKPFSLIRPKTWRIYSPRVPAMYVIELGTGVLGDVSVGDVLKFI